MGVLARVLAVVAVSAVCAAAGGTGGAMDFDRGFNVSAALEAAAPAVQPAAQAKGFMSKLRATKDCSFFTFKAGSPPVSEPAILKSYVFQKVCKGNRCYDELLRTEKRKTVVSLTGTREIFPWEKDVFSVCLEDTVVSAEVTGASHKYELTKVPGKELYEIKAEAKAKLRMEPDYAGITAESWEFKGKTGSLELTLKDKWAAVYGASLAEKTVIKLTVKQENPAWFDGVVFEQELSVAPAELYRLDLSEHASGLRRPLEDGKKYYAQWGFRREGGISKDSFVKGGETARVLFPLR